MKIVCVDNFNRDEISDKLVAENVNPQYAESTVNHLNLRYGGPDSDSFFKAVEDDYKLYTFEP